MEENVSNHTQFLECFRLASDWLRGSMEQLEACVDGAADKVVVQERQDTLAVSHRSVVQERQDTLAVSHRSGKTRRSCLDPPDPLRARAVYVHCCSWPRISITFLHVQVLHSITLYESAE